MTKKSVMKVLSLYRRGLGPHGKTISNIIILKLEYSETIDLMHKHNKYSNHRIVNFLLKILRLISTFE